MSATQVTGWPRTEAPTIELWLVDLERSAATLLEAEQACARLAQDDIERIERMTAADARRERLLSAIAVRLIIARVAGDQRYDRVSFSRTAGGKPFIDGAPLSFSLSHSAGFAMIAATAVPHALLGVDVQPIEPLKMSDDRQRRLVRAGMQLARLPLPQPQANPGDVTAIAEAIGAWVRVEAVSKATGCGVGRVLQRLGVTGAGCSVVAKEIETAAAELLTGIEVRDVDVTAYHPGLRAALASPAGWRCAANPTPFPASSTAIEDVLAQR